MFYAIADKDSKQLLEVTTNAQSSLTGMQAYIKLGYNIVRFGTDAKTFIEYSEGFDHKVNIIDTKYIDGMYRNYYKAVLI